MTDLVDRLRARLKHLRLGEAASENLMDESADEIERLRAEVLHQKAQITRDEEHWEDMKRMSEKHRALWVEAAQDRDRMKVACQFMIDGRWDQACKTARAALGEPKP